jgi:hypothetical protein
MIKPKKVNRIYRIVLEDGESIDYEIDRVELTDVKEEEETLIVYLKEKELILKQKQKEN